MGETWFGFCRPLYKDSAGNVAKSLGFTGNVEEEICQITNNQRFGFEASFT